jgi:hypothetical protein
MYRNITDWWSGPLFSSRRHFCFSPTVQSSMALQKTLLDPPYAPRPVEPRANNSK